MPAEPWLAYSLGWMDESNINWTCQRPFYAYVWNGNHPESVCRWTESAAKLRYNEPMSWMLGHCWFCTQAEFNWIPWHQQVQPRFWTLPWWKSSSVHWLNESIDYHASVLQISKFNRHWTPNLWTWLNNLHSEAIPRICYQRTERKDSGSCWAVMNWTWEHTGYVKMEALITKTAIVAGAVNFAIRINWDRTGGCLFVHKLHHQTVGWLSWIKCRIWKFVHTNTKESRYSVTGEHAMKSISEYPTCSMKEQSDWTEAERTIFQKFKPSLS